MDEKTYRRDMIYPKLASSKPVLNLNLPDSKVQAPATKIWDPGSRILKRGVKESSFRVEIHF